MMRKLEKVHYYYRVVGCIKKFEKQFTKHVVHIHIIDNDQLKSLCQGSKIMVEASSNVDRQSVPHHFK